MTRKENKIINEAIHYLTESESFLKVKQIRQAVNLNPQREIEDEIETLLYLYKNLLEYRTSHKSKVCSTGTHGWNLKYFRKMKKYSKNEKFDITVDFTLVDYDTFD